MAVDDHGGVMMARAQEHVPAMLRPKRGQNVKHVVFYYRSAACSQKRSCWEFRGPTWPPSCAKDARWYGPCAHGGLFRGHVGPRPWSKTAKKHCRTRHFLPLSSSMLRWPMLRLMLRLMEAILDHVAVILGPTWGDVGPSWGFVVAVSRPLDAKPVYTRAGWRWASVVARWGRRMYIHIYIYIIYLFIYYLINSFIHIFLFIYLFIYIIIVIFIHSFIYIYIYIYLFIYLSKTHDILWAQCWAGLSTEYIAWRHEYCWPYLCQAKWCPVDIFWSTWVLMRRQKQPEKRPCSIHLRHRCENWSHEFLMRCTVGGSWGSSLRGMATAQSSAGAWCSHCLGYIYINVDTAHESSPNTNSVLCVSSMRAGLRFARSPQQSGPRPLK